MPGAPTGGRPVQERPLSALPSVRARAAAFAAIVVAGACGALIGYGFVGIQCRGACTNGKGVGLLVGGAMAAAGVAVIAILTLRAMGEWRTIKQAEPPQGPPDALPYAGVPPEDEPPETRAGASTRPDEYRPEEGRPADDRPEDMPPDERPPAGEGPPPPPAEGG